MSGILQRFELRTRQAVEDNVAHGELLYRVLSDEVERRDGKQLDGRLRRASFEHHQAMLDFDFVFNPGIPKAKLIDLSTCSFVERRENVLLIGPTGTGKSHLAQALGHRACRAGHGVLRRCATCSSSCAPPTPTEASTAVFCPSTAPKLPIVDDLGLRPLAGDEPIEPLRDHAPALRAHRRDPQRPTAP